MKQTVNLKLNKPDVGDPVLISDLNGNMDILDKAVSDKADKTELPDTSTLATKKELEAGLAGKQPTGDYAYRSEVPKDTGDLTNNEGFITKAVADLTNYYTTAQTYTREEINSKIASIPGFTISVVSSLPPSGNASTIYLVPKAGAGQDVHDEYIWITDKWELIGSTAVKIEVTQNANGISINGTALQKATAVQDGLMTKEAFNSLANKLDKSGGTMTGALSVPVLSNSGDSYLTGTVFTSNAFSGPYVQVTANAHALDLTGYNGVFIRRDDGYLFYRTFDEMKTDLGIYDKADKSEIPDISGKADQSDLTALASRVTALENIPNANGRSY